MDLRIQRQQSSRLCTQGILPLGDLLLHTLELPWLPDPAYPGGESMRSCVPAGRYRLVLHDTPKHPKSFALVNPTLGVIHQPDPAWPHARTVCLIHIANVPAELLGCIALGLSAGDCCVIRSRSAIVTFKAAVPWVTGHTLTIVAAEQSTDLIARA